MADKTSELDDILSKSVDLKNRRIYFGLPGEEDGNGFSWQSVELAIRAIHKLSADFPKKPIELHMSSTGGEVYQMFRLYHTIQNCSCQIKFYGSGEICSSAVFIMAGCDERNIDPDTSIMIHAGGIGGGAGAYHDVQIENDEFKKNVARLYEILEENSRMPVSFWEEVCQRDLYLTPQEAVDLGLACKITEPKKRGNLRKSRIHILKQLPDKRYLNGLVKKLYKRIHKGKQLSTIEIKIPVEEFDKSITVDKTPVSFVETVVQQHPAGVSLSKLKTPGSTNEDD